MSEKKILVVMPKDLEKHAAPYLEQRKLLNEGYTYKTVFHTGGLFDEDKLCDAIEDCSGYVAHLENVNEKVLSAAKKLKAISKLGVGVDNIDLEMSKKYNVEVSNCPGSNSNAVAELTLSLMINMARNIQNQCNELRNKKWSPEVGSELKNKTIGLLGLGNIGKKLALYLKPFQVKILVYDVIHDDKIASDYGIEYASVESIAKQADYISVHLPLLPSTKNIIDDEFFNKTKDNIFVLNLARGGIINEQALYKAVQNGKVAQVALDAYEVEPPFDSPFLEDNRVIVLPHIGAATSESIVNMLSMSIDNIISVIEKGENPHPV